MEKINEKPYVCYHCKDTKLSKHKLLQNDHLIELIESSNLSAFYNRYFEFCEGKENEFHSEEYKGIFNQYNICESCLREILHEIIEINEGEILNFFFLLNESELMEELFSEKEIYDFKVIANKRYEWFNISKSVLENIRFFEKKGEKTQ